MKCQVIGVKTNKVPSKGLPKEQGVYYNENNDAFMLVIPNGNPIVWNKDCRNHSSEDDVVSWAKDYVWLPCDKGVQVTFTQE